MSEAAQGSPSPRDEAATGGKPGPFAGLARQGGFKLVIAGFSLLGIILGAAAPIYVLVAMNGLRNELLDTTLAMNGHVRVLPMESRLTDWKEVAHRIAQVPGVRFAAPVIDGGALALSSFGSSGVQLRGMLLDDIKRLPVGRNLSQGTLENFDDSDGVVIGSRLADELTLRVGDSITLLASRGGATPVGVAPWTGSYRVAAVFHLGIAEYDAHFVFMPLTQAQACFNRNSVSAIEVFTSAPDRVDSLRMPITTAASRPVFLVDWRRHDGFFFGAFDDARNRMFMILSVLAFMVCGLILLLAKLVLSRSPATLAAPPATNPALSGQPSLREK